jgi:hypothetical protein
MIFMRRGKRNRGIDAVSYGDGLDAVTKTAMVGCPR